MLPHAHRLFIGTAGWSIPRIDQPRFPAGGSHLERYAHVFAGAEINASFHRPIRDTLYAKWAESVPAEFRFSVKLPRTITHELRLLDCEEPLAAFLDASQALGDKLGCLLVQLPPSFAFDDSLAGAFFEVLRALHDGPVVLEPRHVTWFEGEAGRLLEEYGVARVAADPALSDAAALPGGDLGVSYFRLHGSPRVYWSRYDQKFIDALATRIVRALENGGVWCIFDNTASGAALPNALELQARVAARRARHMVRSPADSGVSDGLT